MNKLSPTINQFDVLDKLAESDFNLHLTAEKLKTSVAAVLSHLSPDSESTIINHMKVRMTLESYTLWRNLLPMYVEAFMAAEPKDRIRAFAALTETLSAITKATNSGPVQGAQIGQVVLNMLPPEVRDRVLELLPQEIIINNEVIPTAVADTRSVQDERIA